MVENNTLNISSIYQTNYPCGLFVNKNNAILSLDNIQFKNNKLISTTQPDNALIYNLGLITNFDNCKFIDNNLSSYVSKGYNFYQQSGYIYINPDEFTVTITDSLFENNSCNVIEAVNLNVKNSNFDNNKYIFLESGTPGGGTEPSGIAINATNLNVDNCTFDGNGIISKHEYVGTGGYGGAISATNLVVNNSKFINNVANTTTTWNSLSGTGAAIFVTTDGEIYNSIFENNSVSNPSDAESYSMGYAGSLPGSGADIYSQGNILIQNNTFTRSYASNTASSIYAYVKSNSELTITDNTFTDCKSSLDTIVVEQSDSASDVIVENNIYNNNTINDELTLNVPSKIFTGEPITITGTYNIVNASFYDADILEQNKFNVYINGVLDQTVDTINFTVTPTAGTMMVTVQPTISQTRKTQAIRSTTLTEITITPENYNEYIYEGVLIGVAKDTKIAFQGEFTDKEIKIDTNDVILNGENATFTNTVFILDNENITLTNMNINNINTEYPIKNYRDNNIIANNIISLNNDQEVSATIYNTASNTIIANNTLTIEAPAGSIDFNQQGAAASTQAIFLNGGNNNTVQNNIITATSKTQSGFGTLEAITNCNGATNTLITQNNINISNANFNYAIDCLNNVENITITENNILVTGQRYCDGVQVGNNANNIIVDYNNITCICLNTTPLTDEGAITYGVIATSMGSSQSSNITITNNNIELTGTANYAIELYKVNKTEIHDNNMTVNGPFSMGIGYSYASNGNATGNTITITGDSTTPINMITEEIRPENTGIRVQNGTQNINIEDNTITTSDVGGHDTTIHTDTSAVTIKDNKLISSQGYGDETINAPTDTTIENNIIETTTTTEDINGLKNTPVTLTATVTDELENNVNGGSVIFTDADGNTIATAEVIDGTATTTATFTATGESTITATYTPTSTGLTSSTAEASLVIKDKFATTIIIDEITATAGETITITANVQDENADAVTAGKVTFKVNGKTLKDANGKVIYAKVVEGVATATYEVPLDASGKDLNITAVYSGSSKYDKANATLTTTVTPKELTLTASDVTVASGSTVQLTATLSDNTINNGKIVFKINGKTVKDANGKVVYAKVANGTVSVEYTIPENMKAGDYIITAIYMPSSGDRLESNATLTVTKD